ncbi:MAG: ferritin-like protein [Bdellovibrionota bacterium]
MSESTGIIIESKEQLLSWLAEAAELEHNLLCTYLYAIFSLKKSKAEGISDQELRAIEKWRRVILGIALEEMTHLTLVSNLISSIGGTAHFHRPNLPLDPGFHPSDIVVELAQFNLDTLQHFIFLERPVDTEVPDGESFIRHAKNYTREAPAEERLMPHNADYPSVGELYGAIRTAIESLCGQNEKDFFCGSPTLQVSPTEATIKGMIAVVDKKSAIQALDTIVTQGEGSTVKDGSHFERFSQIKEEY